MLLIIDNFDSFTYNLVQYFCELNQKVKVIANNELDINEIRAIDPEYLVISPGPKTPNDSGISMQAMKQMAGKIPILGVCLGHQAIAQLYGAHIIQAETIMHGKTSPIEHNNKGIFAGINESFRATRYHSLVVDPNSLPDCLEICAWTEETCSDNISIMGLRHKQLDIHGIQFHPESILSEQGYELLSNFLKLKNEH